MSVLSVITKIVWGELLFERKTLFLLCCGSLLVPLAAYADVQGLGYSPQDGYDPTKIECGVDSLFKLIEGAFGALVMVTAGLGAIISAAVGAYRASVSMLVVAVGAYILRALVSLFFGTFIPC